MVNSPPVREKALMKPTQLTSRKARFEEDKPQLPQEVRGRTLSGGPARCLPGRGSRRTANQAMAPAARLASPQATKGASRPQFSASHPPGKGPMPTAKMKVP